MMVPDPHAAAPPDRTPIPVRTGPGSRQVRLLDARLPDRLRAAGVAPALVAHAAALLRAIVALTPDRDPTGSRGWCPAGERDIAAYLGWSVTTTHGRLARIEGQEGRGVLTVRRPTDPGWPDGAPAQGCLRMPTWSTLDESDRRIDPQRSLPLAPAVAERSTRAERSAQVAGGRGGRARKKEEKEEEIHPSTFSSFYSARGARPAAAGAARDDAVAALSACGVLYAVECVDASAASAAAIAAFARELLARRIAGELPYAPGLLYQHLRAARDPIPPLPVALLRTEYRAATERAGRPPPRSLADRFPPRADLEQAHGRSLDALSRPDLLRVANAIVGLTAGETEAIRADPTSPTHRAALLCELARRRAADGGGPPP